MVSDSGGTVGDEYTGVSFAALSGWRVGSEIIRLRNDHDVIIIDSPPHMETEAKTAIRHADLVVIPVQPSPTDVWATQATVQLAERERVMSTAGVESSAAEWKIGCGDSSAVT